MKPMKKLLLIVLMLALIVGVSYVKIMRDRDRHDAAFRAGEKNAHTEVMLAEQTADSLKTALAEREVSFGDTLTARDAAHRAELDSMAATVDSLENRVDNLQTALAKSKTAARKSTASAPKKPSLHEQALTYYKKRYKELPSDLSPYEQTVAVREIREETASRYKITLAELNRIRSEHKLDY